MSFHVSVQDHYKTMGAIDQLLDQMNTTIDQNPEIISEKHLASLDKLFDKITLINQNIFQELQGRKARWVGTKCGRNLVTAIFLATLGGSLAAFVSDVIEAADQYEDQCNRPLPGLIASTLSTVLSFTTTILWNKYSGDQQTYEKHIQELQSKDTQDQMVKRFIESLKSFKQTEKREDQETIFKQCLQELDKIPENVYEQYRFLPRDKWVSAMLQLLTDSHPAKERLKVVYDLAMKVFPRGDTWSAGEEKGAAGAGEEKKGGQIGDPHDSDNYTLNDLQLIASPREGNQLAVLQKRNIMRQQSLSGEFCKAWEELEAVTGGKQILEIYIKGKVLKKPIFSDHGSGADKKTPPLEYRAITICDRNLSEELENGRAFRS